MKFTILLIRICLLLAACFVLAVSGTGAQELSQTHPGETNTGNTLEKIKTDIYRRGIGEKSTVVVKMNNGTTRKGYIQQAADESFDLAIFKTGKTTSIAYRDVAEVKKPGRSLAARFARRFAVATAFTAVVLGIAIGKLGGFE
jgi:hypothetical protein